MNYVAVTEGVKPTKYFMLGEEIAESAVSEAVGCIMNVFGENMLNRRGRVVESTIDDGDFQLLFIENFRPHSLRSDGVDISFWYTPKTKRFYITDETATNVSHHVILAERSSAHGDIATAVQILAGLREGQREAMRDPYTGRCPI